MPVYNTEPYLHESIKSVLSQTHKNLRFIIVNDGSTDGSKQIIDDFASKDSRIFVLHQSNLGHAEAMNNALHLVETEWVFRMDSDDVMYPNRLESQLSFITSNPEIRVASCRAEFIDYKGRAFGVTTNNLRTLDDFYRHISRREMIGILQPGAVMHRDTVLSVGGYRGQFWPADDIDLWNRIAERGGLILIQDEILMKYRIHKSSATTSNFMHSRLQYEWVRACRKARRDGLREPDKTEFLSIWESVSLWRKLNRWRKTFSKYMYRRAGQDFLTGHVLAALLKMGLSFFLQPSYVIPRIIEQLRK